MTQRDPRRGRPQIGDPDFVWQVGMWARRRDGVVVPVVGLDGIPGETQHVWPVVVQRGPADRYSCTEAGERWIGDPSKYDLIKIVGWPKGPRS